MYVLDYILKFQLCCVQDTILVIPPYPYCIEEVPQDVLLEDCWYARAQYLLPASWAKGCETPKESNLHLLP